MAKLKPKKITWNAADSRRETFVAKVCGFEVIVHHYVGFPPDAWFVTVVSKAPGVNRATLIDRNPLKAKNIVGAKVEALEEAQLALVTFAKHLNNAVASLIKATV